MASRPMFPLGSVLFPTMVLPLHIFEPRYHALVRDCLAGDREFGVCLIERGHEVGGGETRSDIGTIAQIVDAQEIGQGSWAIAAVGTRRIRVSQWLADDPYPSAEVEDWLDEPVSDDKLAPQRDSIVDQLRRVLALQTELGMPSAPETTPIDTDPTLAGYQVAALSPMGPFDRQQLLAAASVKQRLQRLDSLLSGFEEDFRGQLDMG